MPDDAGKNTDAKENEYLEPANKLLKREGSFKDVLSEGPSACTGSEDEPVSVITEYETDHWNTNQHDEDSADYESANSPMGSQDYHSDAAMEEAKAAAMEKDAEPDAATPDAEDAELNDAPRAEDAERAKQQRRDESVLGSQDEQYHSRRILMASRDRSVRVVLKKRDQSREMDRNQTDPSLMSEAPWKRRRGSKDAYLCRSRGHKNRSRSRQMREPMRLKPRWGDEIESEVTLGVHISKNLKRRGPFCSKDPTLLKTMRPERKRSLPTFFGKGNFMLSNWTMSKWADPKLVGAKLKIAPFGCIVMIMSSEVAATDEIVVWLSDLANRDKAIVVGKPVRDDLQKEILQEKAVYRLSDTVFVALHKAKVHCAVQVVWSARSRGKAEKKLRFCSLHLTLNDTRQAKKEMTLGIIDVKDVLSAADVDAVVSWVVMDRIAILTGHFGTDKWMIERIAKEANAIHDEVLAQWITFPSRSRGKASWTHPTYFMCFGFHREVRMPEPQELPPDWEIGSDLYREMIECGDVPEWTANDMGSAYVPQLGLIKMKQINFERWCPFVLQTCLWVGTSTPSLKCQAAQIARSGGKSGQHKGHHKGQGNESGQGRGSTAVTWHWWQGQWCNWSDW